MALDATRVRAVTFDSFSTLLDVDSSAAAVADLVDDPVAFARQWHTRAAVYGMVGTAIDAYEPYYDLHRHALAYLLAARGIDVTDERLEELTAVYHELAAFDDVRPGMARLRDAGYALGVVSNGDPPMLESLERVAGIGDLVDAMVSADEVEAHKPARALYEHAAARLDVDPGAVVHASNSVFDVQGAMHAGMQGVWLNREAAPPEPFGPDPDLAVEAMDGLVDALVG